MPRRWARSPRARALRYGTARARVAGVQAVLADGTIIDAECAARDDPTHELVEALQASGVEPDDAVLQLALAHGGRISAEHGVGIAPRCPTSCTGRPVCVLF